MQACRKMHVGGRVWIVKRTTALPRCLPNRVRDAKTLKKGQVPWQTECSTDCNLLTAANLQCQCDTAAANVDCCVAFVQRLFTATRRSQQKRGKKNWIQISFWHPRTRCTNRRFSQGMIEMFVGWLVGRYLAPFDAELVKLDPVLLQEPRVLLRVRLRAQVPDHHQSNVVTDRERGTRHESIGAYY